jgi:DNA-binding HxlR family transcriptional regulator
VIHFIARVLCELYVEPVDPQTENFDARVDKGLNEAGLLNPFATAGERRRRDILAVGHTDLSGFGEFQKSLGISRGILATRLRNLIAQGILEKVPASDGSAYQDYVLSQKGNDLFPVVASLRQWGQYHCFSPGEAHSVLLEKETAQPVCRLELRSKRGRTLLPSDTVVRKVARNKSHQGLRSAPTDRPG